MAVMTPFVHLVGVLPLIGPPTVSVAGPEPVVVEESVSACPAPEGQRGQRGGRKKGGRKKPKGGRKKPKGGRGKPKGGRGPGPKGAPPGAQKGRSAPPPPPPKEPPADAPSTIPLEPGDPGTEAPAALDVRSAGRPLHDDRRGRGGTEILALAGAPSGYTAVWADRRDGRPRLYLGGFDVDGAPRWPAQPLGGTEADEELAPAVRIGPGGGGTVAWYSVRGDAELVSVRTFDEHGTFHQAAQLVAPRRTTEAFEDAPVSRPRLAFDPGGRTAVLWASGPILSLAWLGAEGNLASAVVGLTTPVTPADGPGEIVVDSDGRVAVAYPSALGTLLWLRSLDGSTQRVRLPGVGRPRGFELDRPAPSEPSTGAWLLADGPEGRRLWHLDETMKIDRDPLPVGLGNGIGSERPVGSCELTTWVLGPIVLFGEVEPERPGVASTARAEFLRADGRRLREPLELAELGSREGAAPEDRVHLASAGDRMMAAWTERDVGPPRIVAWTLNPRRGRQPPPVDLVEEVGTGHQHQVRVASNEEATAAVAVWSDGREPIPVVLARVFGVASESDELRVDRPGHAGARWPAVAVDAAGGFVVAWKEERDGRDALVARAFDERGTPRGDPVDVDPGRATQPTSAPAIQALRGGRGFAVVWDRSGDGAHIRHLTRDGELGAYEQRLSNEDVIERPALCLLDDGRAVAAWDGRVPGGLHAVHGHLLGIDLRPDGLPLTFDPMLHGHDWAPALAPAPRSGFVLAWTSGAELEREVFCRFYDGSGEPIAAPFAVGTEAGRQDSPSIARLADRSWVVAWQDDLSGIDRVVARRIHADGRRLGPTVAWEETPDARNPRATKPVLAPYRDGWLGTWVDVRRSRGYDAYVARFGPRFDALPEEEEPTPNVEPSSADDEPEAGESQR